YIILFVVFSLIFYSLISSFLGERGIIANNQLKRQLIENEYELDRRKVQLENLRIKEQELATEDGLRSAAMNLGYQVDSDNVFIFDNEEATISQTTILRFILSFSLTARVLRALSDVIIREILPTE
ncbi:MAG: hypothetical protein HUJ93_03815, partial [Bacteroidales bacterium]|nr:hypothetical protein [Bacteroidales bacterium]